MKRVAHLLAVSCCLLCCSTASAQSPFPRLLPPASDFRLTLREEPQGALPLGSSCSGEAGLTLTCRAFAVTLENLSTRAIRINGVTCREPAIIIEKKEPRATGGWWPVSTPQNLPCPNLLWTNLRLKPGEYTQYATRLISPQRWSESFAPGSYTLRAQWVLFGCTEAPAETDCLAPLQHISEISPVAGVDLQEPVTDLSNEVTTDSPPIPDLGMLKFSFEVSARPSSPGNTVSGEAVVGCNEGTKITIDCIVFHYKIHNLGDRPVRNIVSVCGSLVFLGITPEFRTASGWNPVPGIPRQMPMVCTATFSAEAQIFPGGTNEGDFMFSTLDPGYDTTPLRSPGEHRLRFTFQPRACFASPDASFCLLRPEIQPPILSQEITVQTLTASSSGAQ
jgi:hypothetical protein